MPAFRAALEEHGYWLARGDRRGFVAMDINGEVFSVARWTGVKTKEVNQRLGDPEKLPSVEQVRASVHDRLKGRVRAYIKEGRETQTKELAPVVQALREMVKGHRQERALLETKLESRRLAETKARSERLHKGVRGVWELLTGKARAIRRQNEREAYDGYCRDRDQREALFMAQSKEKEALHKRIASVRARQRMERMQLAGKLADVLRLTSHEQNSRRARTPRLELEL